MHLLVLSQFIQVESQDYPPRRAQYPLPLVREYAVQLACCTLLWLFGSYGHLRCVPMPSPLVYHSLPTANHCDSGYSKYFAVSSLSLTISDSPMPYFISSLWICFVSVNGIFTPDVSEFDIQFSVVGPWGFPTSGHLQ